MLSARRGLPAIADAARCSQNAFIDNVRLTSAAAQADPPKAQLPADQEKATQRVLELAGALPVGVAEVNAR